MNTNLVVLLLIERLVPVEDVAMRTCEVFSGFDMHIVTPEGYRTMDLCVMGEYHASLRFVYMICHYLS